MFFFRKEVINLLKQARFYKNTYKNRYLHFFLESGPPHYRDFTNTLRHTTLSGTPLYEWSAESRHLYLTTYNTCNRQTFVLPAGFETAFPASERPQTHALDRVASRIGRLLLYVSVFKHLLSRSHKIEVIERPQTRKDIEWRHFGQSYKTEHRENLGYLKEKFINRVYVKLEFCVKMHTLFHAKVSLLLTFSL